MISYLRLSLLFFLSFFNTNFQNSFQDVVYYKILGRHTLRHFQQKADFEKMTSFL